MGDGDRNSLAALRTLAKSSTAQRVVACVIAAGGYVLAWDKGLARTDQLASLEKKHADHAAASDAKVASLQERVRILEDFAKRVEVSERTADEVERARLKHVWLAIVLSNSKDPFAAEARFEAQLKDGEPMHEAARSAMRWGSIAKRK